MYITNIIVYIKFVNVHVIFLEIKIENTILTVIPVIASKMTKSKEEVKFYKNLQDLLDTIITGTIAKIQADFNALIVKLPIQGLKQTFKDDGERLI